MGALDTAIVAGFVAYALVAGWRERQTASSGPEQYFLAGRDLNGWQAGISMAATQFAVDTPMLVTGLVAVGGIFALWRLWIYALAFLLLGFLLAACWRRAGSLTDAALAEIRYRGRGAALLRLFKAVYFGIAFNCFAMAIVLLAAARMAEPFLPWHEWLPAPASSALAALARQFDLTLTAAPAGDPDFWLRSGSNLLSLALVALFTLAYSALGGLRAVVRTDMVQFAIMIIASIAFAAVVADRAGGLGTMAEKLHQSLGDGLGPAAMSAPQLLAFTPSAALDTGALLLAVTMLQWLIQANADGTGYLAQRVMACRDDREARRAAIVFTFAQVVLRSIVWLPIALGLLLVFPPTAGTSPAAFVAEREATFVLGIAQLMPIGLLGLMLAGMLAALASTLDTHLNWGASYLTHDLYARFGRRAQGAEPAAAALVRVARISNLLLLAAAFAVMTQLGSIRAAWETGLLLGSGVGVVLVLRWLWWRITAWGELAAIAASAACVPLTLAVIPEQQAPLRLLAVAAFSTAAAIAVSLRVQPAAPGDVLAFYRRVRPPGAWGPVARLAGEDPGRPVRELGRGLAAMALCAVTVFGLLIGAGTLLVDGTPPGWLPHRGSWIALNIGAAVCAIPFWLKLGFARPPD